MKRNKALSLIALLALMTLLLAACGKSEFRLTENTEKRMIITAENADKDAFFMVGSLVVADGERISISSNLKKGLIRVEIVEVPAEQSIEKLPETDSEPIIMALLENTESSSGGVRAGTYMLRATCVEKATGTVRIEVSSAE